jgi:hypothetical protein
MKCPQCGKWNRASFPTCQYCGAELPQEEKQEEPSWRATLKDDQRGKAYIRVDEEGNAETAPDRRDVLANEMSELKVRKAEGREKQRQLRAESAKRGSAPSGMTVRSNTTHDDFWQIADDPKATVRIHRQGGTEDPDRFSATQTHRITPVGNDLAGGRSYDPMWGDEDEFVGTHQMPPLQATRSFTAKLPNRRRGTRHLIRALTIILIVGLAGLAGFFGYHFFKDRQDAIKEQNAATVVASIKDDLAAHTIMIPGEDGTQIYIRELHTSYIVTGGFATVEIADHTWYDDKTDYLDETMEVTLTPFVKTTSGQQEPLDPITYEIEIPLSPIELVTPDANRVEVSSSMYTMEFTVRPGSTVTINGVDCSDTVNSETGSLSYNATVQPQGDNLFTIVCRSQYCRENTMQVVLYREKQEIPLDLAADTYTSTSSSYMLVSATTMPGADIEVSSPYRDLNITELDTTGAFSFYAIFEQIGNNTITITASMEGKKSSVINYTVYYVPPASTYTTKAWAMDSTNYNELLNNMAVRAANNQVYVIKGKVQYSVSDKPQMVVINTSDDGLSQPVLVQNYSKTTWVVGETYEIYADAYSTYNSMPWLYARYTYQR